MKPKCFPAILLLILFCVIISCDSGQTPFEDTIPKHRLSTSVVPSEGGTIHPDEGEFEFNTGIEIEARPAEGFIFDRWGGNLSGNSNPESVVFTDDRSVTAYFIERDYPLELDVEGEGTILEEIVERADTSATSDSLAVPITTVRLTAVPEDGWFFDRWDGDLNGSENPETIVVDNEKQVTAIFLADTAGVFTISIDTEGEGSVSLDPDKSEFREGEEVIITATPESGWRFVEWSGDLSGTDNSQTVEISGNIEAAALFLEIEEPALSIQQQPSEVVAGSAISPNPEVQLTDELGIPVEGAEVTVSLNKNSFSSESSATTTTNSNGIAEFDQLIINTAASGYTLSFETDYEDVSSISSTPFEVIAAAGDPENSSAIVSDGSVDSPPEIEITVLDRFENRVSGAENDLSVTISGANDYEAEITETEPGLYSAYYSPTVAGTDQISITLQNNAIPDSPFTAEIEAGAPYEIQITEQPRSVVAGRTLSPVPAVRLFDEFENPISGTTVSADLKGATFSSSSGTSVETDSDGVARFESLRIHTAGSGYRIDFTADNISQESDRFDVIPADPDLSDSDVSVPNGEAGSATEITIYLVDPFGNGVSGMSDNLSVDVSGANSRSLTVTAGNEPGTYQTEYIPERAGDDQIDVHFNGEPVAGSPYTSVVSPGDISPVVSSVTADPLSLFTGESSIVTIVLRDEFENPIGNLSDNDFTIDLIGDADRTSIEETSDSGTYVFEVTSESETEESVSVIVTASGITLDDSPEIVFQPLIPEEIIIKVQPNNSRSGEPILGPPTVRVLDVLGDGLPNVPVHVSTESGQDFDSGTLTVYTDHQGVAVFDDLVLVTTVRWFNLVFSVEGVDDVVSDRFRVSFLGF